MAVTGRHDDEPVLVFLHAAVCDRRMWGPQVAALEGRFTLRAPDLKGFGEAPYAPGAFSYADDVASVLDEAGADSAVLIGSSFGGRVALETATKWPDRIAGLVLLCSALRGLPDTAASQAFDSNEEELLRAGDVDGAVELNLRTWLGPSASEETRALMATMQRGAFVHQLAAEHLEPEPAPVKDTIDPTSLTMPALVVGGGHDLDLFQQIARHLATWLPDAELVVLDWAGHLPSLERPDDVTSLIEDFLQRRLGLGT